MRIGLSQSTAISPMDPLQLGRTLQLMRRDVAEGVTEEVALAAAEREGLKGVIAGEVAAVGNRLTISARLVTTAGEMLLAETEQVAVRMNWWTRWIDSRTGCGSALVSPSGTFGPGHPSSV